MGNWIRKNLVLVAGIVLPVLLVVGFFLLQAPTRYLAEPPGYDFLVVTYGYDANDPKDYRLSFEVRNNRLRGKASPLASGNSRYPNHQRVTLYRYEASKNAFTEISWDTPAGLDNLEKPVRFGLPETAHLKLDKSSLSPDGYRFEHGDYRGRGGLLGELFGMGRSHDRPFVLEKEGAYFRLPNLRAQADYYGNTVRFLGWVLEEETSS